LDSVPVPKEESTGDSRTQHKLKLKKKLKKRIDGGESLLASVPDYEESTSSKQPVVSEESTSQVDQLESAPVSEESHGLSIAKEITMEALPLVIFSSCERNVLKNYFEMHDSDGSGSLCISELMLVIDDIDRAPMPGSEEEAALNKLFAVADEDKSGELNYDEFLNVIEN
jgi:hypothetical protein